MGSRIGSALCVVSLVAVFAASPARATVFEGEWVGGFRGDGDWVFAKLTLGGEATVPSGRMDLPLQGQRGVLLREVRFRGGRVSFEVPAAQGPILFEGRAEDGRIRGSVRQGFTVGSFEMLRLAPLAAERRAALHGSYDLGGNRTVLLHDGPQGFAYVDYGTGRLGHLYPVGADRFVSGPTLLSAYPVELTVTIERDAWGSVTGLLWERRGEEAVRGRRTLFYRTEDVEYRSGDVQIGASLLTPMRRGPFPAVVLLHGSGAVSRGALMPMADALARGGVAVLVPDKRGVGASTGNLVRATFDDLAGDALAGVEFLKGRSEIDPRRIGLQGASLGGWVAPLAASKSPDVAFIIIEAAPAVTPAEHERQRVENQMRADGFPRDLIAQAVAFMDEKAQVGRTGQGWNALERIMQKGRAEGWLGYTNPPSSLESLVWQWQHVMSYDPLPALEKVTCPVLALYGELDTIVTPAANRQRIERALARGGHVDLTVDVLPRANHNFFAANSGGPNEVPRLRGFVPGYFERRVEWLQARAGTPALAVPVVVAVAENIDLDDVSGAVTRGPSEPPNR